MVEMMNQPNCVWRRQDEPIIARLSKHSVIRAEFNPSHCFKPSITIENVFILNQMDRASILKTKTKNVREYFFLYITAPWPQSDWRDIRC
jgi:hypothetical protein